MLRLNVEKLKGRVTAYDATRNAGTLRSAQGVLQASLPGSIGDVCRIRLDRSRSVLAEITGFRNDDTQILPYEPVDGLPRGATVTCLARRLRIPFGDRLLGRVIDGLGRPLDNGGRVITGRLIEAKRYVPSALERPTIREPFVTGQRVLDGLLTCGQGQRVGLFAGGGVGKTTLLAEIARGATSDVNVIAMIGERGREVRPFIEEALGEDGLRRSVVIVATSDQPAVLRVRAAQTAVSIADQFRQAGNRVLFLFDSLTRLATAQREVGLLTGEPPSARGFPPSSLRILAEVLEQLGTSPRGSITGILTVLVDGDDVDEPVADAVRALLDGHFVMDRSLAEKGRFPSVNVSRSVSRVFRDVTDEQQQHDARNLRQILATHDEVADLIRIGAYTAGTSPQVDKAIQLLPVVETFLQQRVGEYSSLEETRSVMQRIAAAWPF